jgi:hypothetical protein
LSSTKAQKPSPGNKRTTNAKNQNPPAAKPQTSIAKPATSQQKQPSAAVHKQTTSTKKPSAKEKPATAINKKASLRRPCWSPDQQELTVCHIYLLGTNMASSYRLQFSPTEIVAIIQCIKQKRKKQIADKKKLYKKLPY